MIFLMERSITLEDVSDFSRGSKLLATRRVGKGWGGSVAWPVEHLDIKPSVNIHTPPTKLDKRFVLNHPSPTNPSYALNFHKSSC